MRTNEIKNEIYKIKKWEERLNKKIENMKQVNINMIHMAEITRLRWIKLILLKHMIKFNKKSRSKTKEGKKEKRITFDSLSAHYEIWKLTLNALGHGIFSTK